MATDQAIMEAVGAGQAPPTLRFYAWFPACLSLGYGQHSRDADPERLRQFGWDIVRRPTGGKAILHTDELTYSIALPQDAPLVAGSIVESYRRLSTALLESLERLGAQVESTPNQQASRAEGPVCFEVPSNYEITANGHKLIGSAQVRRANAVLQHGSLPLSGDIARICDGLAFANEAERDGARHGVRQRATTLEAVTRQPVTWHEVASVMSAAFAETFDIQLEPGELSANEQQRRDQLCEEIYGHPDWTWRR